MVKTEETITSRGRTHEWKKLKEEKEEIFEANRSVGRSCAGRQKNKNELGSLFVCGVVVWRDDKFTGAQWAREDAGPVPNRLQNSGLRESRSCRVQCNRVVDCSREHAQDLYRRNTIIKSTTRNIRKIFDCKTHCKLSSYCGITRDS